MRIRYFCMCRLAQLSSHPVSSFAPTVGSLQRQPRSQLRPALVFFWRTRGTERSHPRATPTTAMSDNQEVRQQAVPYVGAVASPCARCSASARSARVPREFRRSNRSTPGQSAGREAERGAEGTHIDGKHVQQVVGSESARSQVDAPFAPFEYVVRSLSDAVLACSASCHCSVRRRPRRCTSRTRSASTARRMTHQPPPPPLRLAPPRR